VDLVLKYPTVPLKTSRRWKTRFGQALYRRGNAIERFYRKIRYFCRIATRSEEKGSNDLPQAKLASPLIWVLACELETLGILGITLYKGSGKLALRLLNNHVMS